MERKVGPSSFINWQTKYNSLLDLADGWESYKKNFFVKFHAIFVKSFQKPSWYELYVYTFYMWIKTYLLWKYRVLCILVYLFLQLQLFFFHHLCYTLFSQLLSVLVKLFYVEKAQQCYLNWDFSSLINELSADYLTCILLFSPRNHKSTKAVIFSGSFSLSSKKEIFSKS